MLKLISTKILNLFGWQLDIVLPEEKKFVLIGAPHTSNWDFPLAMLAFWTIDLKIFWVAKIQMFWGPLHYLFTALGGIPIDRKKSKGFIEQIADKFNQTDEMVLTIAPEGTRKHTDEWKTGFLHIAYAANVPVVPMALDFRTKEFIVMPPVTLSGDIEADLALIKQQFPKAMAKYPSNVSG